MSNLTMEGREMHHDLDTIATDSRKLLGERAWPIPVRMVIGIIGRHRFGDGSTADAPAPGGRP